MGPHYFYHSILFFDRTAGLFALVAAMFTVSWIQRHNEMTALMAAGISRVRVVKPVIIAAVVVAVFAAANRELVIPRLRDESGAPARRHARQRRPAFAPAGRLPDRRADPREQDLCQSSRESRAPTSSCRFR